MSILRQMTILASCGFVFALNGQGLYLQDGELTVQNTASVTIQGDLSSESQASVDNLGTIRVRDNILNNGGNILFTNQTGGSVILYGNNQLIGGVDSTVFYNLEFQGTAYAVKNFVLPAAITNELDVNNQVMQTNNNRVYLMNPVANSLAFNAGYIASDDLGGYFVRAVNSTDEYIFPLGAENLTPFYRVVGVTPLNNQQGMYEARLAPVGAQVDFSGTSASGAVGPFDINEKTPDLGALNPIFYHNIHRLDGAMNADVDVYFSSIDGGYFTLAQWKGTQFENPLDELTVVNDFGLDRMVSLKNFDDFEDDVFVLASADTIPDEPCPDFFFPTIFSPNNDGTNDQLCVYWGCLTDIEVSIFNRWGEIVFYSKDPQECWNGEQNGELVNTGAFVYMVKGIDSNTGEEVMYSGNLTVTR